MHDQISPDSKSTQPAHQRANNWGWTRFNNSLNQTWVTWYAFAKQIPNLLTLLRIVLAIGLFMSGLIDGQASPARDIWLIVIGWTTDMADGRIARYLKKKRNLVWLRIAWPTALVKKYNAIQSNVLKQKPENTSWLGQHDVYVDMFVSLAVLGYLVVTALIPLWLALIYLLIWGVLFLRWGIPEIFAQVFQNPIYAAFIFLMVRAEPKVLPWLLLWAVISLLFFWRRLLQLVKGLWHTIRD